MPHTLTRLKSFASRAINCAVHGLLFCFLLTAFVHQSSMLIELFDRIDPAFLIAVPLLIGACGLLLFFFTSRWFAAASDRAFLTLIFSLFGLLHLPVLLPWRYLVNNDFLTMHQAAARMITQSWSDIIRGLDSTMAERALVYLYPVYKIFGPSLTLAKALNILLILASGGFLYFCCRQALSRRMARAALVMFFLCPARYWYATLPTHDLAGLFYIGLFSAVFLVARRSFESRRWLPLAGWSLALAVCLVLNGLARTISVHWIITLAALALLAALRLAPIPRRPALASLLFALFLFLIPVLLGSWGLKALGRYQRTQNNTKVLFTANASDRSGHVDDLRYHERYTALLDRPADIRHYALGRLASEYYFNFPHFLRMFKRKVEALAYPSGELWFLVDPQTLDIWRPPRALGLLFLLAPWAQTFIGLLGAAWLIRKRPNAGFQIIGVFAFVCVVLLLFSEAQPRYTYLLHYYYAAVAGIGMIGLGELFRGGRTAFFAVRRRALPGLALVAMAVPLLFAGARIAGNRLLRASDYLFVNLAAPATVTCAGDPQAAPSELLAEAAPPQRRPFSVVPRLPASLPGLLQVCWSVPVKPGRSYRLTGFLDSPATTAPLNLSLDVGGQKLIELKNDPVAPLRFITSEPFAARFDRTTLTLRLSRTAALTTTRTLALEYLMLIETRGH